MPSVIKHVLPARQPRHHGAKQEGSDHRQGTPLRWVRPSGFTLRTPASWMSCI